MGKGAAAGWSHGDHSSRSHPQTHSCRAHLSRGLGPRPLGQALREPLGKLRPHRKPAAQGGSHSGLLGPPWTPQEGDLLLYLSVPPQNAGMSQRPPAQR